MSIYLGVILRRLITQPVKYALGATLYFLSLSSFAAPVTFLLGDHPDAALYGGGSGDPYGLRYDDQAPPGNGPTYSAGTNLGGSGGPLTLTWDSTDLSAGAVIAGVIHRNDDTTLWDVSYTLGGLALTGDGGFTASSGTGFLDEQSGPGFLTLTGKAETGSTVVFEFDNDGHRLSSTDGWVGRGWLEPSTATDDWLLTGTEVPIPAAAWLFGSALIGLAGIGRNRKRKA